MREALKCLGGHVFKLRGHPSGQQAQRFQAVFLGVIAAQEMLSHATGRTTGVGVQHSGVVTHGLGGLHQHASELPTPQHPNASRRRQIGQSAQRWAVGVGVKGHGEVPLCSGQWRCGNEHTLASRLGLGLAVGLEFNLQSWLMQC